MDLEIMRAESRLIDKIIIGVKIAAKYEEYKLNGLLEALKCLNIWAEEIVPETVEAIREIEERYDTRLMKTLKNFKLPLKNGTYKQINDYQEKGGEI